MSTPVELLQGALVNLRRHEVALSEHATTIKALVAKVQELEQKLAAIESGDCMAGGTPT
jgi:hypothetical protein